MMRITTLHNLSYCESSLEGEGDIEIPPCHPRGFQHMYPPDTIATDRELSVREVSIGDIVAYYRVYSDDSVAAYEDFDVVTTLESAEDSIEGALDTYLEISPQELMFAIDVAHNGVVGFLYMFPLEFNRHARLGYHLDPKHRGFGYASRAVEALIAHLRDMGYRKASALVYRENEKSVKLLERQGFVLNPEHEVPMACKGKVMTEVEYVRKLY